MKTTIGNFARCFAATALHFAVAGTAFAGTHTWDVNEVFSNADGSVQFVELVEANGTPNELGVPGQTLSSSLESFTIGGGPLSPPTSNKFFLIATAAFAALPGAPTPDSIVLASNTPIFANTGDTINYGPYDSLAFGSVPTNGILSLNRNLTTGTNSPTNYAGTSGSVDASTPAPLPALNEWGMGLAAGLLLLAGAAVVLRSRARTA
ncbi:MAG TPA: IPTL-CTERM sorting domain-containing protein [Myxococcota bacterium]|jgi:hypothetical protein